MGPDIGPILEQWAYEPGQITVRKIRGLDGREKLQLRLDLGLLQMETQGRPDGRKPYGCASVLAYVENQLARHARQHGDDHGFVLAERLVREMQEEALMNYHRYLSLYVLEDFDGVVRDTAANLRIFDLVSKYGPTDEYRLSMEQYRPYVIMMNARARAQQAIDRADHAQALAITNSALGAIKEFFRSHGRPRLFRRSNEAAVLRELRREIASHLPKDPIRLLSRRLRRAVQAERYEEAAKLRDQIAHMQADRKTPPSE